MVQTTNGLSSSKRCAYCQIVRSELKPGVVLASIIYIWSPFTSLYKRVNWRIHADRFFWLITYLSWSNNMWRICIEQLTPADAHSTLAVRWPCVGTKLRPSTNHRLFTKAIYSNLCYVEIGIGNMRLASRYAITACREKVKKFQSGRKRNYRQLSFLHCFNGNFGG